MTENKMRGVIKIKCNGKEYPFQLTTNALVAVEERLGMSMLKIDTDKISIGMLRVFLWAGFQEFDENITEKQAGKIIDTIGWDRAQEIFFESFSYIFPTVKKEDKETGEAKGNTSEKNLTPLPEPGLNS